MYNIQMIERLAAVRRSDLSKEVEMTRLPKKTEVNRPGFVLRYLKNIGDFVGSVGLNLKEWGHSNAKVSSTTIDT